MKKLFILLLILSFNSTTLATHDKSEEPSYSDYIVHKWDDYDFFIATNLTLAKKGFLNAQLELVRYYSSQKERYPEALYWFHKVLEHQCGWSQITDGISLLREKRPQDHGLDGEGLNAILYALLNLYYEDFLNTEDKPKYYKVSVKEDLDAIEEHAKKEILILKNKLDEDTLKRAQEYSDGLKSKWTTWDNLDEQDLYNSHKYNCYWNTLGKYEAEMVKIYKAHLERFETKK